MKIKMKYIVAQACLVAGASMALTSCNDFLDREPLDQVTPQEYFQTADHLAAYTISKYNSMFSTHSGWNAGTVNNDGGTDNMVVGGYNSTYYEKGIWKVPSNNDNWSNGLSLARYCNYFFEQVLPKYEAGKISGSEDDLKHYIGEMYFMRALVYYNQLRKYGDYPIITEVLPDDEAILIEKSIRQPRNKVARFILEDLDKAIGLMKNQSFMSNNRLNKQCALLIKSRVALYEATFEKYHQGTGRVPGDETWPGKSVHPNFSLDVAAEINFFLDQCMDAASQVADAITLTENTGVFNPLSDSEYSGWNPYFEMFSAEDMSGYSEVLFWKDYLRSGSINISHGAPNYIYSGGNNGMLRSYVQTFLMENGLPWYASNSGFKGDSRVQEEKEGRDQRLQLFLFGEKDKQAPRADGDGTMPEFGEPALFELQEVRDLTGYRIRKCLTYKKDQIISGSDQSTTGCIIYRGVEAYLNYLEAYYLRNGKVDGKAAQYWTAIRKRGGVDTDYEKTIRNTDMSKEVDWAKYSGSTLVDATLFNIRRERRCEFIGEGMRWDDLMRWRAMDQLLTTKYVPEGFNFWDEAYDDYVAMKNDKGEPKYKIVSDGSSTANMSAKELGKYVRPYSIVKANNAVFDGYTFAKAYYLYPVPIRQMELLSPDRSVNSSVLYQNPYWPNKTSEPAIE